MTIKTITGSYSSGYVLGSQYSGLNIASSAFVGGAGVQAAEDVTINNSGSVDASGTSAGVTLDNGGMVDNLSGGLIVGYVGIDIDNKTAGNSATVNNFATIAGSGAAGVYMYDGVVINGATTDNAALIEGKSGIQFAAVGTLINSGVVTGEYSDGVLAHGGVIANGAAAARIQGVFFGVITQGGLETVTNAGTILATGGGGAYGAALGSGGSVANGTVNKTTALIEGYGGLRLLGAATVTNFGTVEGAGVAHGCGIYTSASGGITNGAVGDRRALIEGYVGVRVHADPGVSDTVTNFGTIRGHATAVSFNAPTDVLVVEAGCAFVGAVLGGGGTLDLASGAETVTGLSVGGNSTVSGGIAATIFTNFGTVEVGKSAAVLVTGSAAINAGHVLIDAGTLTLAGPLANAGVLTVTDATLIVANGGAILTGGGEVALNNSAANRVHGASAAATLNNIDNTILGAGQLGDGQMILVNHTAGIIDGNLSNALVVNTGANVIVNAGVIEVTGLGGVTVDSAVTGGGSARVKIGTLFFASSFSQNVTFTSATGMLALARSQTYDGSITGFSRTGGTSLDLRDIGFVGAGEATFSGTTTSGILTITDGVHTAHITLVGDYENSTFVASSDLHGGVIVIDPTRPSGAPPPAPLPFIAAMAGLGADAGSHTQIAAEPWRAASSLLTAPRVQLA